MPVTADFENRIWEGPSAGSAVRWPVRPCRDVRLAVVLSHPIPYYCCQYSSWSRLPGLDLTVFFASRMGLAPYDDPGFRQRIAWTGLPLDFAHVFLPGAEARANSAGIDAPGLAPSLERFNPDLVLVHGYAQPLARRTAAWARSRGIRLAMISDAGLHTKRTPLRKLVKALFLRHLFRGVDAFLTVGDRNEAYYRAYGVPDERMFRATFPVDIQAFGERDRSKARARLTARFGLSGNELIALNVGKFIALKRQRDLLSAAAESATSNRPIALVLAGSGDGMDAVRREATDCSPGLRVILPGFVQGAELNDIYLGSDILVHSAENEAFGVVVAEAAYAGLPLVLSDQTGATGPSSIARNGVNAIVYQCGNIAALTSAIRRLADDPALREEMGRRSREIAVEQQALAHGGALRAMLSGLGLPLPQGQNGQ